MMCARSRGIGHGERQVKGLPRAGLLAIYVLLVCVPLVVAAAPPRPAGRPFWLELAIALGFIGLAQLAVQFGLIARFQSISRPYGIDLVMQYHRQIGMIAVAIVLLHGLLLPIQRPAYLRLLDPARSGIGGIAGVLSVIALLVLVVVSVGRKEIALRYEAWRLWHALLAAGALALAQVHVSLVGIYVDVAWKHAALILFSSAFVGLVAYLRLVMPIVLRRRPYEVIEVRPEAGSTWVVAVAPVGHAGLRFVPGQFAWLKLGVSPWSLEEHPFSFSSSADARGPIEFAIKELGDFTRSIGSVRPGTRAYLDGPHGSFSIDDWPSDGYLFVAGGIGISPILSMLRTLADRRDTRSHVLVYATSRWDRTAFREILADLARVLRLRVIHVLEEPHEGFDGEKGFVTRDLLERVIAEEGVVRDAFVCGPDPMMSAVEKGLRACGVPARRIHLERFDLV
jgi:predicted ferric reductase